MISLSLIKIQRGKLRGGMFEGVRRDNTTVRSRTEAKIELCGPLRISAISVFQNCFQRRDRRDTQRAAELIQHLVDQSIDVNTRSVEQADAVVFLIT